MSMGSCPSLAMSAMNPMPRAGPWTPHCKPVVGVELGRLLDVDDVEIVVTVTVLLGVVEVVTDDIVLAEDTFANMEVKVVKEDEISVDVKVEVCVVGDVVLVNEGVTTGEEEGKPEENGMATEVVVVTLKAGVTEEMADETDPVGTKVKLVVFEKTTVAVVSAKDVVLL